MKIEIVNKTLNDELEYLKYIQSYCPELVLTPADIELFIRKCIRNHNFSVLNFPVITIKFNCSLSLFKTFEYFRFSPVLQNIELDNISFYLGDKFQENAKIQSYLIGIVKKISVLKDLSLKNEEIINFIPLSTNVSFLITETLKSWMNIIISKSNNNDFIDIMMLIERELVKFYPSVINEKTLKLYTIHNLKQ